MISSSNNSFINGQSNTISKSCCSYILGNSNIICSVCTGSGAYDPKSIANVISGGISNKISNAYTGYFGCNQSNVISGGTCNLICNGYLRYHTIGGGFCNGIGTCSSYYTEFVGHTIAGGACNYIGNDPHNTGGGNPAGCYSTIGGGFTNRIVSFRCFSFIGGGQSNQVYNNAAVVAGGASNRACGNVSAIVGGFDVVASGNYSFVGGGQSVTASGYLSSILGGISNTVSHLKSIIIGSNLTSAAACTSYHNAISKTSGTFQISHPDPAKTATKYLQHSFVESPTRGDNIYRYKITTYNCQASLALPDYYKFLNENDQVWVSPVCHFGSAYGVVDPSQSCVTFTSNCDGDYNVLVIGTRKDKDAKDGFLGVEVWK